MSPDNISVGQFRLHRHRMEAAIAKAVTEAMADFRQQTGLSPRAVHVELVESRTLGEVEPRYYVSRVDAEVRL